MIGSYKTTIAIDRHGRNIMTVGQLRGILHGVDPDVHVVIATDDWYVNVESAVVPGDDGDGYLAVTLYPGFPYDSRQT